MENFFNYITKPLNPEDVDTWFKANNIIFEKLELYSDFSHSLYYLIVDTYLGDSQSSNETKITLSDEDKSKHFDWCWKKTIKNFSNEEIFFESEGEHHEYFKTFFEDIFYNQPEDKIRKSIGSFFKDLFDREKSFTKSDLDMILTIYKLLDKYNITGI